MARAGLGSGFGPRCNSALRPPAVVKAHTNPLIIRVIERDFVAEPAFPEEHVAHLGLDIDEGLERTRGVLSTTRGGHHHGVAGVFEFDGAGALGHGDVSGAADDRMGVEG